ncbi:hypothetical protein GCM10023200_03280 [Actinomycetospora chlora]|uniref:DUF4386 domain-containing protein n=1 Tax=Actinomycetospora chlora TaxID=663608 RepID=A0ABP9A6R1_9PSEU
MTATVSADTPRRPREAPWRRTSVTAGVFYLATFVSIPVLGLYGPVHEPGYVTGPGPDTAVVVGGLLELVVAVACIGTAVALFPVVKQQNEGLALGFVASRTVEATVIVIGVVALFAVVGLRRDLAGGPAAIPTARALVAVYDQTFLLGQGLAPVANALLLGTLLYRSRLVPRAIPLLGLVGAPILLASKVATIVGLDGPLSAWSALATVPIAAWELSLGLWLVVRGVTPPRPGQHLTRGVRGRARRRPRGRSCPRGPRGGGGPTPPPPR